MPLQPGLGFGIHLKFVASFSSQFDIRCSTFRIRKMDFTKKLEQERRTTARALANWRSNFELKPDHVP